jgi:hypothetical protein
MAIMRSNPVRGVNNEFPRENDRQQGTYQVQCPHEVERHTGGHEEVAEMVLFPYRPTGQYII